ncbi:hypothetical protein A8F97_11870 [Pectobacterium parmentieri]|nr:hypothetical protein A8F97_11870 [Pectobacterium parmentieri]
MQHLIRAFDDLPSNIAFMRRAHIGHSVAAHRTPRFGAQSLWLFGAVDTKSLIGPVATVFPEFIACDDHESTDVGHQGEKRQAGERGNDGSP